MEGPRPIDVYGDCISNLQGLRRELQEWSVWTPLRHQLILWHGPSDPPTAEARDKFLLEVGIFPFEASEPDGKAEFYFLPGASRWNGFRWRETPRIREEEYDVLREFEQLTLNTYGGLSRMLKAHQWCLPSRECSVPKWFLPGRDPPFGMTYHWLQFVYDCASAWPVLPDVPAWMPKTRELVGKKAKAKLIESEDIWMLSAEAISRWLPPDVDDFLSDWKEIATASRVARGAARPRWDAENRVLTYKGNEIKRLKRGAKNQICLLDAFEKARWIGVVGEPDEWKKSVDPKRFDSTVRQLNKYHITEHQMYFEMRGTTEATWHLGRKPTK